ncbi:MAG TPA: hypothetical protein PKN27_05660 [Propionibacteriaceae bacterium]|nr:hypothetical protein [Propionibacteriaceae bacterium]
MPLIHLTVAAPTPTGWRGIADDGTVRDLPSTSLDAALVTVRAGQRVWAEVSVDDPRRVTRFGIGPR